MMLRGLRLRTPSESASGHGTKLSFKSLTCAFCMKMDKKLRASGGLPPDPNSDQGLCLQGRIQKIVLGGAHCTLVAKDDEARRRRGIGLGRKFTPSPLPS